MLRCVDGVVLGPTIAAPCSAALAAALLLWQRRHVRLQRAASLRQRPAVHRIPHHAIGSSFSNPGNWRVRGSDDAHGQRSTRRPQRTCMTRHHFAPSCNFTCDDCCQARVTAAADDITRSGGDSPDALSFLAAPLPPPKCRSTAGATAAARHVRCRYRLQIAHRSGDAPCRTALHRDCDEIAMCELLWIRSTATLE